MTHFADFVLSAVLVFSMCRLAISALNDGNQTVTTTIKRIFGKEPLPKTPQDLCNKVLHTVYMGMSKQSSHETRQRAKDLAAKINAFHLNTDIDEIYKAQKDLVTNALDKDFKFKMEGGTPEEGLVLQNIQARTRMVTAYQFAQALPITRGLAGGVLVLGSANVGESEYINSPKMTVANSYAGLRGYLTKGDASFGLYQAQYLR